MIVCHFTARGVYIRTCEHGNGDPCEGVPDNFTCDICTSDACNNQEPSISTEVTTESSTEGVPSLKCYQCNSLHHEHCGANFIPSESKSYLSGCPATIYPNPICVMIMDACEYPFQNHLSIHFQNIITTEYSKYVIRFVLMTALGIYVRTCAKGDGNPCEGMPDSYSCAICRTDGW